MRSVPRSPPQVRGRATDQRGPDKRRDREFSWDRPKDGRVARRAHPGRAGRLGAAGDRGPGEPRRPELGAALTRVDRLAGARSEADSRAHPPSRLVGGSPMPLDGPNRCGGPPGSHRTSDSSRLLCASDCSYTHTGSRLRQRHPSFDGLGRPMATDTWWPSRRTRHHPATGGSEVATLQSPPHDRPSKRPVAAGRAPVEETTR
jgi:hypothetical protein